MSYVDVESACSALSLAAELITDPRTSKDERVRAYHECERFKESSPVAAECGFRLASDSSKSLVVRIFGLKILEDSIKSRWNDFPPEVKLSLKENLMTMIRCSLGDILNEPVHIKDGISRCVVEIIKREWPQRWPTLLSELNGLCVTEIGTEISLFVILRLVEDVAVLQTLEQIQRRKDIYSALTLELGEIFNFLMGLLERHYKAYLASAEPSDKKRQVKVCSAVLGTYNAFVEWVPISYVMANKKYLIRCLCHLLGDESLQLNAGECLLSIVSNKPGKMPDRLQLLSLFETDMITPIFSATETAEQKSSSDESHYIFLKKMVQVLVELGSQLCAVWSSKENKSSRPENFQIYLNALLFFTRHPSLTVNLLVNELWNKFFRHAEISEDQVLKEFVPKWIDAALKKTIKLPLRSQGFSLLDFETEEEYGTFFGRYRIIILEGIRLVCYNYTPTLPYDQTEEWLRSLLTAPTLAESSYLQLDAVSVVLEAILSKSDVSSILGRASNLLKSTLEYVTSDPVLTSVLLSCISSLFSVVTHDSTLLPAVMSKIFSCITFTSKSVLEGQLLPPETVALRRHGCSLLVKIATKYAPTLHPIFDHLKDTVAGLKDSERIGKMEFSSLVEALVLVSNEFKNYSLQSSFIESASAFTVEQFQSLQHVISSSEAFIEFIGLTKVNDEKADKNPSDPFYNNRSKISFCTIFLLSICRRAKVPSDVIICRTGGFILNEEQTSNGSIISLRNPASNVANAVLPLIFNVARVISSLWMPDTITKYEHSKTLDMMDTEKTSITGNSPEYIPSENKDKKKSSRERMKGFLYETFENLYHFLSECCSSFGVEFYQLPGLTEALRAYIFEGITNLPDYRLRCIVKTFMKCFINKCPQNSYGSVLSPILCEFCPYMLNRLTERWKYVESLVRGDDESSRDDDSQEVLDDVILRHLTREYLDVIKAIFTSGGGSDVRVSVPTTTSSEESNNLTNLSELGRLVLSNDSLRECLIVTLLRALVWRDSNASVRACNLLELILPGVVKSGKLGPDGARHIMISILSAIHTLGQHELNNIALTQLAIQAYEWMRPGNPSVMQVLAQVPGCNQEDLRRFDDRIMVSINGIENTKGGDRAKKDMFKKLINQFIGKDVAQMFKKEVVIKNLPSLIPTKTRHNSNLYGEDNGLSLSLENWFH